MDQASDIASIMEFYQLHNERDINECRDLGVNTGAYFASAIFAFSFYRLISTAAIYSFTNAFWPSFRQLCDLEIFVALFNSHRLGRDTPGNVQRYIQSLEAVFESSIQSVIQFSFLIKIGALSNGGSYVIVISLFFSMWSIISKSISEDKTVIEEKYRTFSYDYKISIMRYTWRMMEVSSRIIILSLIWVVCGGYALILLIIIDFIVIMIAPLAGNCINFGNDVHDTPSTRER